MGADFPGAVGAIELGEKVPWPRRTPNNLKFELKPIHCYVLMQLRNAVVRHTVVSLGERGGTDRPG